MRRRLGMLLLATAASCASEGSPDSVAARRELDQIGPALQATKRFDGALTIEAGDAEIHVTGSTAIVLSSRGSERAITLRVTEARPLSLRSLGFELDWSPSSESTEPWVAIERSRLEPDLSKPDASTPLSKQLPFGLYEGARVRDLVIHLVEGGQIEFLCLDFKSLDGEQQLPELSMIVEGSLLKDAPAASAAPR